MAEPLVHRIPRDPRERGDEPSFLAVVLISAVVLAVFLVGAYFVLRGAAGDLMPGGSTSSHAHSMLRVTGPPARSA